MGTRHFFTTELGHFMFLNRKSNAYEHEDGYWRLRFFEFSVVGHSCKEYSSWHEHELPLPPKPSQRAEASQHCLGVLRLFSGEDFLEGSIGRQIIS